MKSPRAALVATAISLMTTSLPAIAGELPFNAPDTERAKESAPLLHQAARALSDLPAGAALRVSANSHISNLWLFPTADADTVFARYNLTSDNEVATGTAAAVTEHLAVLTVRGDRVLAARDLTAAGVELASVESAANAPARLHWSAAIGTGHAVSATVTKPDGTGSGAADSGSTRTSHGVSASPDWTAKIGTGHASDSTI